MRVLINGIGGAMGKTLFSKLQSEKEAETVCGVDKFITNNTFNIPVFTSCKDVNIKVDCIIDFSFHNAVYDYIPYAVENRIPCVIATTGFNTEEQNLINEAAKSIAIFQSGNMSIGINLLLKLVKQASASIGDKADIEIIEMHHNQKADAPSGTALMLANGIKSILPSSEFVFGREGLVGKRTKNEIGIHSVRGGSIVGKHNVMFILNNEIITLSHEAESKSVLAEGSINAAYFIIKQSAGKYDMNDLLK